MQKVCEAPACPRAGEPFEAKRAAAKYCGDTCRKRAQRAPAQPASPVRRRQPRSHLAKATQGELAKLGRLSGSAGQAALLLAKRIDAGGAETGAALAAMIREHANAMERATKEGPAADPIQARQDEVAKRRERHRTAR